MLSVCTFQPISGVFSQTFLSKELTLAENIRDKQNRKIVLHLLKTLQHHLQVTVANEHGAAFFVGVSHTQEDVCEIITPPNPIGSFSYTCDRTFDTAPLQDLFLVGEDMVLLLLNGKEALIYKRPNVMTPWNKQKTITSCLVKRHSKGGQSALRFSRLAEESREGYITRIQDALQTSSQVNCFVYGSKELKQQFLQCMPHFQTSDAYDVVSASSVNEPFFKTLQPRKTIGDAEAAIVLECLQTQPELLLFNLVEVQEHNAQIEYIIQVESSKIQLPAECKVLVLALNHPLYAKFKAYDFIAKLYYVY